MKLTRADLEATISMFGILDAATSVHEVLEVEITFRAEGGDFITVGYDEDGAPAVLDVTTELAVELQSQPGWFNPSPSPPTINPFPAVPNTPYIWSGDPHGLTVTKSDDSNVVSINSIRGDGTRDPGC